MVKVICFAKRKDGMSFREFDQYWGGKHAQVATGLQRLLKYERYVQVHAIQTLNDLGPKFGWGAFENVFDGLAYLEYAHRQSIDELMADPRVVEGFAKAREDELNFLDVSRSIFWVGEEKIVVG